LAISGIAARRCPLADYFTRILPLWRMRNIACNSSSNGTPAH
jgi:hypothetical protein